MILAYRLVRLIEAHSEGLVRTLQQKIKESDRCSDYGNVPPGELLRTVGEIYKHIGEWLLGKTEADIQTRYEAIGARRAEQGVPLSQVIWMIALVKDNLWEYLRREELEEQPAGAFSAMEILRLVDQFTDHATYYAALGYERARHTHPQTAQTLTTGRDPEPR